MKLDAERESEHALLEEGRARIARLEVSVAVSVLLPQSLLQRWKQSCCAFEQSQPTHTQRFPHSPIVSGISSPTLWKRLHCGCDAGSKTWRTRLPKFRRGCFQVGARHRRGSNSVASVDTTTLVSVEHGEFSHVSKVAPRIRILYGLRGHRIGEASNPGPASRRRRTQRLRSLQRATDSDSESEDECRNVARRLEGDEQPLEVTSHMDVVPSSDNVGH